MAVDLNQLVDEFRGTVENLITNCGQRGVEMRPNAGLRTPFDQARLWRQSRTTEEILEKIDDLRRAGADFIAFCLESVGATTRRPGHECSAGILLAPMGRGARLFLGGGRQSRVVDGQEGERVERLPRVRGGGRGAGVDGRRPLDHVERLASRSDARREQSGQDHVINQIDEGMRARFG